MVSRNDADLFGNFSVTTRMFGIQRKGILQTHNKSQCDGTFCSIHNPSNHPLRDAPLNWRGDRKMMERICEHGVGHPDPDDVAHHHQVAPQDDNWYSVHGCDGCCQKKNGE